MSESPVEHFEHAEHAEHAALLGDPFLTQVAVTIATLAVIGIAAIPAGTLVDPSPRVQSDLGQRRFHARFRLRPS